MLCKEISAATSEVLEMWGDRVLFMDMFQKGGAPSKRRGAVKESIEASVQRVQRG